MSDKILVAFASRSGATKGVAETIGNSLAEKGLAVDICSMQDVKDISSYRAIIAGSAIQAGKWLPEATEFVKKYQKELSGKPFAAFLVCMTLAMPKGEAYRKHVSSWLEPVRNMVKPVHEGLFAGTLDISKVPGLGDRIKFRLSVLFGFWKEGDHRNWEEIRKWAEELRELIC